MHYTPKKMTPEILKVFSLSSTLCFEDQIKFLDVLSTTQDPAQKKLIIDRALVGERVWEEEQVV
jgi:hypothetical protein